jgi:hypothetical protein
MICLVKYTDRVVPLTKEDRQDVGKNFNPSKGGGGDSLDDVSWR